MWLTIVHGALCVPTICWNVEGLVLLTNMSDYSRTIEDYIKSSKKSILIEAVWILVLVLVFIGFVLLYKYLCFDMTDSNKAKFFQNPFWSAILLVVGPFIAMVYFIIFGMKDKDMMPVALLILLPPIIIMISTFAFSDAMLDELTAEGMLRFRIMVVISLIVQLGVGWFIGIRLNECMESRIKMHSLLTWTNPAYNDYSNVRKSLVDSELTFKCAITHGWRSTETRNVLEWSTREVPTYGRMNADINVGNGSLGGTKIGYISYYGQTGTKREAYVSGSHKEQHTVYHKKNVFKTKDLLEAFNEFGKYEKTPGYTLLIKTNYGMAVTFVSESKKP